MLGGTADPAVVESLRGPLVIGSRAFADQLKQRAWKQNLQGVSGQRELRHRADIATVRSWVEQIKGEPWERFGARHGDWGCALFLWGARRFCGASLREIGEAAGGISMAAVSKLITRFEARAAGDEAMRRAQERLMQMSNV
jgi:hypothetical protein